MSHVVHAEAGDVTITPGALQQIVVAAAEGVDGVRVRRPRRHLEIAVSGGSARVELELAIRHGRVIPDAAREVQEQVAGALGTMTGLEVDAVDVAVEELE
jgi:uncharacterized alkaline shock family protein YloU